MAVPSPEIGFGTSEIPPTIGGLSKQTARPEIRPEMGRPNRPIVVHLTASRFFGAPERQMLELGRELNSSYQSAYMSFSEGGQCAEFVATAMAVGFEASALRYDFPRLSAALCELKWRIKELGASLLCTHGYKANMLGLGAARRLGIPIVAVSHGWTGETLRVRIYDRLDQWIIRWMDKVACVSKGQADKVQRFGVSACKVDIVYDAVRAENFVKPEPGYRKRLESFFPVTPALIVGAAGRLSPEKGFHVFIDAVAQVVACLEDVGFVLFGEGVLRDKLQRQIDAAGLSDRCRLVGFHKDFHSFLPNLNLFVQSSFTEGLPNVILEAAASGVAVIATDVGGTQEIIRDGDTGYLVPSGSASALSRRIIEVLGNDADRQGKASAAKDRVSRFFTFKRQAESYNALFASLLAANRRQI